MAKDKNEVKQYDIKVPVFLTDEKDSDENIDLFGSKMSSQMVSIIKEHFSHITKQEFETDIKLIPVWIRKILLAI